VDADAKRIGAVNVIKFKNGKRIGYNTDSMAFYDTLLNWIPKEKNSKALILGSGGSSKAVREALFKLKIPFKLVSRDKGKGDYTYQQINHEPEVYKDHLLIINTTPLGMHPHTEGMPPIDYEKITKEHYVYDLIYNPARTVFLQKAEMRGAHIKNGLEMLHNQAEKSWEIWNE